MHECRVIAPLAMGVDGRLASEARSRRCRRRDSISVRETRRCEACALRPEECGARLASAARVLVWR